MSATAPQFICDCSVSYFGWNSLGCKQKWNCVKEKFTMKTKMDIILK